MSDARVVVALLESKDELGFRESTATRSKDGDRECYLRMDLVNKAVVNQSAELTLQTWLGDSANEAIFVASTSNAK